MKENGFKDFARSTFYAFLVTVSLVLVFAVVVKYASLGDKAIGGINIAIKGLSILFGVFKGTKCQKYGAVKGLFSAVTYTLLCMIVFLLLDGGAKNVSATLIDFGFAAVVGVVSGILAVNIKNNAQNG